VHQVGNQYIVMTNMCPVKCSRIPLIKHPGTRQVPDDRIFHFIAQYI